MWRSTMSGKRKESEKDRWLLARIAGPLAGMCSPPSTHGLNSTFSHGPMRMCFRNQ